MRKSEDEKNEKNKIQIYSDFGYIEVDKNELIDNSTSQISFEKKLIKMEGKLNKSSLSEKIFVNLKTLYGSRKTYSFEVPIKARLSILVDKLVEEEALSEEKQKWNPSFQYRLISTNGLIKELNSSLSFIDEEIKAGYTLILVSPYKLFFSEEMKHNGIQLEELNSIAHNQSGNEEHLLVLCDRGYKSGKHYIEFTLETEPCESSVIIGVTHIRDDYYFNINDHRNFWGYIPSEGSKIANSSVTELGLPCKLNDKLGLLLNFTKTGLDIRLTINNCEDIMLYKNLPLGPTYYPCSVLKFDGMKIRVSNRVPIPNDKKS